MQTRTTYRQLQPEERMTLASMCQARSSVRAMTRALERSPLAADNYLERSCCLTTECFPARLGLRAARAATPASDQTPGSPGRATVQGGC